MNLIRYERVDQWAVKDAIKNDPNLTTLSTYQIQRITDTIYDKFTVVKFHGKDKPSSILARVTLPLYIVFFLLALISMPIKYLFTGSFYYELESPVGRFAQWYAKKLNL